MFSGHPHSQPRCTGLPWTGFGVLDLKCSVPGVVLEVSKGEAVPRESFESSRSLCKLQGALPPTNTMGAQEHLEDPRTGCSRPELRRLRAPFVGRELLSQQPMPQRRVPVSQVPLLGSHLAVPFLPSGRSLSFGNVSPPTLGQQETFCLWVTVSMEGPWPSQPQPPSKASFGGQGSGTGESVFLLFSSLQADTGCPPLQRSPPPRETQGCVEALRVPGQAWEGPGSNPPSTPSCFSASWKKQREDGEELEANNKQDY